MMQSRQAVSALARRFVTGNSDAPIAFTLGMRHLSGSSAIFHVQPALVEDQPSSSIDETPRWRRELGAIRTDWT